jgi:hypothetical protein
MLNSGSNFSLMKETTHNLAVAKSQTTNEKPIAKGLDCPGSNPGGAISDLSRANLIYSPGFGQVIPLLVPVNTGGIESFS